MANRKRPKRSATRQQRNEPWLGVYGEMGRAWRESQHTSGDSQMKVDEPTDEEVDAVCEAVRADISKYTSLTLTHDDMVFLHAIGALDWDWAGSMMFQRVIGENGTIEEKRRLAAMRVGFRFSEDSNP